jgi:formylglycine-generating enzyme required for sulfatase activity
LAGAAALALFLGVLGYALFSGTTGRPAPTQAQANLNQSTPPPTNPKPPDTKPEAKPPDGPIVPPPPRPFEKLPGKEYYTNSIGIHFVKVPKGTFWMGGGGGKPGTKQVAIETDFYLGVYEVTQEQWQAVMNRNPSYFARTGGGKDKVKDVPDGELAQFPVETVSWDDCQEFIRRLNEQEKAGAEWVYRLPTEAEREYACRGGATSPQDCGFDFYLDEPTNTLPPAQANFTDSKLGRPVPVGSYLPNRLGLYDMHGNIHEWCQDVHTVGGPARVARGGSWTYTAAYCRAAYRYGNPPTLRYYALGFRLARVPSGPEGK